MEYMSDQHEKLQFSNMVYKYMLHTVFSKPNHLTIMLFLLFFNQKYKDKNQKYYKDNNIFYLFH